MMDADRSGSVVCLTAGLLRLTSDWQLYEPAQRAAAVSWRAKHQMLGLRCAPFMGVQ